MVLACDSIRSASTEGEGGRGMLGDRGTRAVVRGVRLGRLTESESDLFFGYVG